ncbi:mitotic checkpoint regulator, MAD2B-interacting-domain-containing protein [Collybia nuda]|uniref:Mitotic checkpoint regulator, MAD2B-interacting-domain-containing protein n=1 Tax=Collybia nuda TaxID=64659 RepID=A0A9P6CLB6_9AGAR|nr:mitotic checkpoint regulator, MAD2B-interacting-domain-containing protein [Collybia nuda]
MVLGVEGYGSDTDNESDKEGQPVLNSELPKKPSLQPSSTTTAKVSFPPKPKRAPKKITIGPPSFSVHEGVDVDDLKDERPAKKLRLGSGSGASSLLSMLPAPKQKNPMILLPPERVLGERTGVGPTLNTFHHITVPGNDVSIPEKDKTATIPFLPSSIGKGRLNISVEDSNSVMQSRTQAPAVPPVDFFSLGNSVVSSSNPIAPTSESLPARLLPSSAPIVPTFEPPVPLQTDPYPGYYQLPSGDWAAHDPLYYARYVKKWEAEYNAHVRALEKGTEKGFEGLETATIEEVDAMKEMEKAKVEIKEREERKAVTQGAGGGPVAPKMNINASKLSGIARSRHQLSTLLKEAYENREALEEKIAQGRRNRKEAGNKYVNNTPPGF